MLIVVRSTNLASFIFIVFGILILIFNFYVIVVLSVAFLTNILSFFQIKSWFYLQRYAQSELKPYLNKETEPWSVEVNHSGTISLISGRFLHKGDTFLVNKIWGSLLRLFFERYSPAIKSETEDEITSSPVKCCVIWL